MLNLVWPLSRLGGVLWGLLLPPSLPSPLPSPGRGMRDLEGLSTEVPLGSEAAPRGWWQPSPSLTSQSSLSWPVFLNLFFLPVSPACMHPSVSAWVQLPELLQLFVTPKAFNQGCSGSDVLYHRKLFKTSDSTVQFLWRTDKMAHCSVLISPGRWSVKPLLMSGFLHIY